jgi:hypothetical protein
MFTIAELLAVSLPPNDVLKAVGGVFGFGVVIIVLSHLLPKWKDNWHGSNFFKKCRELAVFEVVRDIGIAFVVAGVVSGVYEWTTRSIDENKKAVNLFNTINSYNVGEPVWTELRNEVFRAPLMRRNIHIRLKLTRNWAVGRGEIIPLPTHQAILWMEYSYDLYPLTNESWNLSIQHQLDYEMFDKTLGVPRFDRIKLTKQATQWEAQTEEFKGSDLDQFSDGKGTINLDPRKFKNIDLPSPNDNRPINVLSERYEIVSTPGQYRLTMPVLVARGPSEAHTINISIEGIPDDIEAEVNSFYTGLNFKPDPSKRNWTFDGVMLPGQGINIVFRVVPSKERVAPTITGHVNELEQTVQRLRQNLDRITLILHPADRQRGGEIANYLFVA